MSFIVISILIFEILLIVLGLFFVWSWLTQTPFYPSSAKRLKDLIESKEIVLPENAHFIDIGSGDGRIVQMMSDLCKTSEGIEFNPFLTLVSKLKLFLSGKKNTTIYNGDFFKHDFSKYNVAYLYIFNEQIVKLQERLFTEMPKGSILITNTFKIKDREPDKVLKKIYIYNI